LSPAAWTGSAESDWQWKQGLRWLLHGSAVFATGNGIRSANQLLYIADTENHACAGLTSSFRWLKPLQGTGEQSHNIHPHGGLGLETALNSPWEKVGTAS